MFSIITKLYHSRVLPDGLDSKETACNAGDPVQFLGWEDSLEEGMASHSSILTWRIPWTEEPGRLYIVHGITKSWTLSLYHSRGKS